MFKVVRQQNKGASNTVAQNRRSSERGPVPSSSALHQPAPSTSAPFGNTASESLLARIAIGFPPSAPQPASRQRKDIDPGMIQRVAQKGLYTSSSKLPYAEQIQKSFGHHSLHHALAHLGQDATKQALRLRASAYTTGEHIVFAGRPDLHTVAHEAAHIVQQRRGVRIPGDIGQEGDVYERQADTVAERVVARQPVEDLLDQFTGGRATVPSIPRSSFPLTLQFKPLKVEYDKANTIWIVQGRPTFRSFVTKAVCSEWNSRSENAARQLDPKKVNFSDEELDRCHIVSWETIREQMIRPYLDGTLTASDFIQKTDALYAGQQPKDWHEMDVIRQKVIGAKGVPSEDDVKSLCVALNSASLNLRADDHTINIKIKGRLDPPIMQSPGGTNRLTDAAKLNIAVTRSLSSPLYTPKKTSFYTSSQEGATIPFVSLSPVSHAILTKKPVPATLPSAVSAVTLPVNTGSTTTGLSTGPIATVPLPITTTLSSVPLGTTGSSAKQPYDLNDLLADSQFQAYLDQQYSKNFRERVAQAVGKHQGKLTGKNDLKAILEIHHTQKDMESRFYQDTNIA